MGIKTKLNARLAKWQRADLFEANILANKISLPQGPQFHWKRILIHTGAVIVFPFSVAVALSKANFVSRNIGLK